MKQLMAEAVSLLEEVTESLACNLENKRIASFDTVEMQISYSHEHEPLPSLNVAGGTGSYRRWRACR